MRKVLHTPDDRRTWAAYLYQQPLPVTVSIRKGVNRTDQQNHLQWMWAEEIAQQTGADRHDVQAEWKLRIGVPILRQIDGEFRDIYDSTIKPLPTYEMKVKAVRVLDFKVTSRMKTPEMIEYLDTVQRECLQAGFQLTDPDPELSQYHDKHRKKGPRNE